MKVGSLVYSTDQGLGYLAKAFYDHGVITHPLIVLHAHRENHLDWFPSAQAVPIRKLAYPNNARLVRDFCRSMDVMLFLETPFDWSLIEFCRRHNVKTVLMPMYECTPEHIPAVPNAFFCPSELDADHFLDGMTPPPFLPRSGKLGKSLAYLTPVPVEVHWQQRTKARTFVHNAGNGGLKGRNGTAEFLESLWLCDCLKGNGDGRIIIRSQERLPDAGPKGDLGGRITWINGTVSREQLYAEGDVFVFPEKFNGLSLPLQEAYASGMLVMATNRYPMNTWLPQAPLIPTTKARRNRIGPAYLEFDEAIVSPKDIAACIDEWYDKDISALSAQGRAWAEANSWERLKPRYQQALLEVREGNNYTDPANLEW